MHTGQKDCATLPPAICPAPRVSLASFPHIRYTTLSMTKVKNTKTELKAQKDALSRFQKFLPMLQLKKQQLQSEIAHIRTKVATLEASIRAAEDAMASWVSLLSDASIPIPLAMDSIQRETGNIAGVSIPLFKGIHTRRLPVDLYHTPAWVDDAVDAIEALLRFRAEIAVLHEQRYLIEEELHTTSQRVNLFEKVKIPECKENIRIIRIHIGDEQTSAVARGKIAKGRGGLDDDSGATETDKEGVA